MVSPLLKALFTEPHCACASPVASTKDVISIARIFLVITGVIKGFLSPFLMLFGGKSSIFLEKSSLFNKVESFKKI